jgi:hypothetical protein
MSRPVIETVRWPRVCGVEAGLGGRSSNAGGDDPEPHGIMGGDTDLTEILESI